MDDATLARDQPRAPPAAAPARRRLALGLSGRLLGLTVLFVMLAEVLIYAPSVGGFQRSWLSDRLAAAQIAALVLEAGPPGANMPELERQLLEGVGAELVAVRGGGVRRLLAVDEMPPRVDRTVDLRDQGPIEAIAAAFATLTRPHAGPIRVIGPGAGPAAERIDFVEIVIDPGPLRAALLAYSRNILILSLIISAITAGLVVLALEAVIVRPVRRLSANLERFSEEPEDASRILAPSARADEIGVAERALARMERALADELRSKRRLAELGLGVAKINHELRNILTSAQLISDRLAALPDPSVQRVAPRLLATLGRAVAFSEATLAYGRAAEPDPVRRLVPVADLVEDLAGVPGLVLDADAPLGEGETRLLVDAPADVLVDADREQLGRVLVNLARNAVAAAAKLPPERRVLEIRARREDGACAIRVADRGPGLPAAVRARLFEPFAGASGGAGLGLAVCAEIVRLHGGTIALEEPAAEGAAFRVVVPDRP